MASSSMDEGPPKLRDRTTEEEERGELGGRGASGTKSVTEPECFFFSVSKLRLNYYWGQKLVCSISRISF